MPASRRDVWEATDSIRGAVLEARNLIIEVTNREFTKLIGPGFPNFTFEFSKSLS